MTIIGSTGDYDAAAAAIVGNVRVPRTLFVVDVVQTCHAFPSQWDAQTTGGRSVYVRYRWGYLSVDVDGEFYWGDQVGDAFDGVMEWDRVEELAPIMMV